MKKFQIFKKFGPENSAYRDFQTRRDGGARGQGGRNAE